MSYRIEFEKLALQQLKKLDPHKYPLLSGILASFRKIALGTPGGEYRIVYALDEKFKAVNIVFIGSRENFYKELQRYLG